MQWALVQDGTGKTAKEIKQMGQLNRHMTASLRARYLKEMNPSDTRR